MDGAILAGEPAVPPGGPFRLEQVDEIGSTSEALKARAVAGAGSEIALLARRQTSGHGRLGRPWRSIEGNLHLSVLLRPRTLRWPGHWSILSAVALADAVRPYVEGAHNLRLKWPNDVMLKDGKLAGILLEAGFPDPPWLVIGFGVNLAGAPPGLGRATACLADVAPAPTPERFAAGLLDVLQRWRMRYDREGFAPVRAAWLAMSHMPGDPVVAGVGERRIAGAFRGLGLDGTLLLDSADGEVAITAGELE